MYQIVNPHLATVGCECHRVQSLVQLHIGRFVVEFSCSVATLVRKPQLGTFGNIVTYHNVDNIAAIGIDTCGVIHITVGIDAQVACNLVLNTIGLVHLHAELLGIVAAPGIGHSPQAVVCIVVAIGAVGRCHGCLGPVTAIDLVDHSLQAQWEGLIRFAVLSCRK